MKLITKIKEIPRKKAIVIGALVLALTGTVAFTLITARRNAARYDTGGGASNENISVFKHSQDEVPTTKTVDTSEPLDTSGVNGLKYVSKNDGTCIIAGIGTCQETELKIPAYSPSGDVITQIADSAFQNCSQLVTVTIPATVKSIGAGVFRGCSNLVSINVDTDNTVYCSVGGVLFSEDKNVLVAYPMNRPGNNYLLPTDTKAVAAYAFEGALNITNLLYQGSIDEFQKIEFLMGNGIIDEIMITCKYVAAK